jgi:hypothetical protein
MQETGMVGVCDHCKLRVPIYDTHIRLLLGNHGIFEIGVGEENITCPGSNTDDFEIVTNRGIKQE